MEPPAKRQKISQAESFPAPSRTIDLSQFRRNLYKRSRPGKVILPRAPDVTVTAAVVEVAVNDGSLAVEVTPSATGAVAVTLSNMGTLTVPPLTTSSADSSSSRSSSLESDSSDLRSSTSSVVRSSNSTITSGDRTVTITATNTFRVSYTNGTFITPAHTSRPTGSGSDDSSSSDSDSSVYVFGQGFTDYTSSGATGTTYNGVNPPTNPTLSSASPSDTGNSTGPTGPVLTPQQTQMVGGIVGGVAGVAFVLVVILYVLRWYRQRLKQQGRLPEQLDSMHDHDTDYGDKALVSMAAPMSQTSRAPFFAPVALKKFRHRSDLTINTMSTAADSEKGFRRVSGRKIPSVLSTGGDQYGGSYGAFEKEMGASLVKTRTLGAPPSRTQDMSEKSFYREADGTTYIGSTPSRTNPFDSTSHSAPASPLNPSAAHTPYMNHSRPRPHPARRPSMPLSNTASGLASPTTVSPYMRHVHNESTDSQFDPTSFDEAFQRNIAIMKTIAKTGTKVDGYAISRNSPARTPVIQSPGAGTLRLPMGVTAGYSMDDDVPEMPLPSPGIVGGMRMPSGLSAVSSSQDSSVSRRFREEL